MQNKLYIQNNQLIGSSPIFQKTVAEAKLLSGKNANVLIVGESGTGKELFARLVHNVENDRSRPFVAVNCAAIPDQLIEAELFGFEKGSFTGAVSKRVGKFELANGGDIFLDEIATLKLELQAKILRVLQEKEVVRLGGNQPIRTNFRVIAATNMDLVPLVSSGAFRIDLFHRLRVVQLSIPPLRERSEDIAELAMHFARKYSSDHIKNVALCALEKLRSHTWPGNVRELENIIHAATILSRSNTITERDLPEWAFTNSLDAKVQTSELSPPCDIDAATYRRFLDRAEGLALAKALTKCGGDRSKTADLLEISRTTLYVKLKQLGLFSKKNAL